MCMQQTGIADDVFMQKQTHWQDKVYKEIIGDATTAKGPVCDKRTNLRLRDFAVVRLMPTRVYIQI